MGLFDAAKSFAESSVGSGVADYFSAKSLQDDAQSHQTKLFANKHQYEVRDLRAAGLNPILSATQTGASAPGSSIASASPGKTAVASKQATTAKSLMVAQRQLLGAQAGKEQSMDAQAQAQTNLLNIQKQLQESGLPLAYKTRDFWNSPAGEAAFWADQILPRANAATDLIPFSRVFRGLGKKGKRGKPRNFSPRLNNPANRGY